MGNDVLLQLGVGGIFAVLILKEVLPFITKRNSSNSWYKLFRQVDDLHKWHDKEDIDGVKVWYIPHRLSKTIDRLANAVEEQNALLKELIRIVKGVKEDIEDVKEKRFTNGKN